VAVGSFLGGAAIGGFLTSSAVRKRHLKELKSKQEDWERLKQYYQKRDSEWDSEYRNLYSAYDKLQKETVERDYEEFKAPDADNDDMISRSEFSSYVKKYLSSFPELSEKDFPKFDDFDLDGDGMVSFDEWQRFLAQQKLKEEKKPLKSVLGGSDGGAAGNNKDNNNLYQELLNALYEQSTQADNFDSLKKNLNSNNNNGGKNTKKGSDSTSFVGGGGGRMKAF
jgi:Ca2+-binding EF-hand superfamily protein